MAIKEIEIFNNNYQIAYEILNQGQEVSILFLHGWGANKEIMKKAFASHFPNFTQIYLDLPGFGKSTSHQPLNSYKYKKIIDEFLLKINISPKIIVGHSFGGKLASLIDPQILVLLSSAGIVNKKSFGVRFKISLFKILKKLGFGKFYQLFASKDVSKMDRVMYETFKNVVDEDFSQEFEKVSGKTLIFWGKDDKATPLKNGKIIENLIKNSQIFELEGDHFFFLLHSNFISNIIKSEALGDD